MKNNFVKNFTELFLKIFDKRRGRWREIGEDRRR
jgi:hypothetical protein